MQLPPPVKSFLNQADLAGKTVLPFNIHGGYGAGGTFAQIARLAPKSTVKAGFSVKGSQEREGQGLVVQGAYARQVETELVRWLMQAGG